MGMNLGGMSISTVQYSVCECEAVCNSVLDSTIRVDGSCVW